MADIVWVWCHVYPNVSRCLWVLVFIYNCHERLHQQVWKTFKTCEYEYGFKFIHVSSRTGNFAKTWVGVRTSYKSDMWPGHLYAHFESACQCVTKGRGLGGNPQLVVPLCAPKEFFFYFKKKNAPTHILCIELDLRTHCTFISLSVLLKLHKMFSKIQFCGAYFIFGETCHHYGEFFHGIMAATSILSPLGPLWPLILSIHYTFQINYPDSPILCSNTVKIAILLSYLTQTLWHMRTLNNSMSYCP